MEAQKPYAATGLSFEQFLQQFENVHAEYVMGNVEVILTNNTMHQEILSFLDGLLRLVLGILKNGRLLVAGVPMFVGEDVPAREPDLMIIFNDNSAQVKATYLDGVADIVVEIVSPESQDRDLGTKRREYESAGVREYWLFNPIHQEADIYALQDNGRYRRLEKDRQGRVISSLLPGFALDPQILWRDVLPVGEELIDLAREMTKQR